MQKLDLSSNPRFPVREAEGPKGHACVLVKPQNMGLTASAAPARFSTVQRSSAQFSTGQLEVKRVRG